jgi:hypothetical protein
MRGLEALLIYFYITHLLGGGIILMMRGNQSGCLRPEMETHRSYFQLQKSGTVEGMEHVFDIHSLVHFRMKKAVYFQLQPELHNVFAKGKESWRRM